MILIGIGVVIVEICNANAITAFDWDEFEREFSEVSVIRMECLNLCGLCTVRPFAHGKKVFAKTIEQCVGLIKEKVIQELAEFN